jgi:hypothetical protein
MTPQSVPTSTSRQPDLRELLAEALAAADPQIAPRLGNDPEAHLDLVALALAARAETDALLRSAVSSARTAGCTWEAIGRVLDMSRQAAQQRFGGDVSEPARPGGRVQRLAPLSAVNEMGVLERAGRYGWHSIGYGPLFHIVEKSDVQWEHRRLVALGRSRHRSAENGWERIGEGWFPWLYEKRATVLPALPEPTADDYLMRP